MSNPVVLHFAEKFAKQENTKRAHKFTSIAAKVLDHLTAIKQNYVLDCLRKSHLEQRMLEFHQAS